MIRKAENKEYRKGLARLLKLSGSDLLFLAEALYWLVAASLMISLMPFKAVAQVASAESGNVCSLDEAGRRKLASKVRWAVTAWAKRAPWRALCFQRGLAAQAMLRRRGVSSTLYYGAAKQEGRGIIAHVWVRDGDIDVIGCENLEAQSLLASFPDKKTQS